MLQRFIDRTLDSIVTRAVADSSRARELCAQLEGRSFGIVVTGSPWTLQLNVHNTSMRMQMTDTDSAFVADAVVRGSAVALLGALAAGQPALLRSQALVIEGDAEIAQQFSALLQLLRPDIEQQLGRLIGPMPAHLVWRGARHAWRQGQTLLRDQTQNAADWLAYERRALVPAPEAEHRFREIEAAREHLDRLEARLRELEARS